MSLTRPVGFAAGKKYRDPSSSHIQSPLRISFSNCRSTSEVGSCHVTIGTRGARGNRPTRPARFSIPNTRRRAERLVCTICLQSRRPAFECEPDRTLFYLFSQCREGRKADIWVGYLEYNIFHSPNQYEEPSCEYLISTKPSLELGATLSAAQRK